MGLKEQLESDIISFFKQIENQSSSDQRETLRLLMEKYIHLSKTEFLMDKHDLDSIINGAKMLMANKSFPAFLGKAKKRVFENEQTTLCIIESTVSHFNKNDCLKKLPKFDYREDKF